MDMRIVKLKRVARRWPRVWAGECWEPVFNRGQVLTFLVAVIGLQLVLQNRPVPEKLDELALDWAITVEAFGIALIGWAIISAVRAPLIIIREDRERGMWLGNRYIYRQPLLATTLRCKPTGGVEMYRFKVPDVEPGSFMEYEIHVQGPPVELVEISLGGKALTGPHRTQWPAMGGCLLPEDNYAIFRIKLPERVVSATVRIYVRSFTIGNPDDKDGEAGNYRFPIRQTAQGNGERSSA